jgi:hypothetical protein
MRTYLQDSAGRSERLEIPRVISDRIFPQTGQAYCLEQYVSIQWVRGLPGGLGLNGYANPCSLDDLLD